MRRHLWLPPLVVMLLAFGPAPFLANRYRVLPDHLAYGWLLISGALVAAAAFAGSKLVARLCLGGFVALMLALDFVGVSGLLRVILTAGNSLRGGSLLLSAAICWLANVATFSLVFWYLEEILRKEDAPRGLLFPEPDETPEEHNIFDYIFVAASSALAFGPTDTPPANTATRLAMLAEALVSFVIVALVAARAVNAIQ